MAGSKAPKRKSGARSKSELKKNFLTIGIGASAGGVEALREFFAKMPVDSGMAFVVVLHLSQTHESNFAEILQRETLMPVVQVYETTHVQPNRVYVVPPAKGLEMTDGIVYLNDRIRPRGQRVIIDRFFRSLADAYGERAVGVVLSGSGADGTLGIKKIKEFNGFAIAQKPEDAQFDQMPRSAIETGLIDWVLPIADMAEKLLSLRHSTERLKLTGSGDGDFIKELNGAELLREIVEILRVRTGHDFTSYKRETLLRRIARHVQIHELPDLNAYVKLLRESPVESETLLRNLLINVTSFFRDKQAFEVLEEEAIPRLFLGKSAEDQLRVWTAGCASGEEAYSLAILLHEFAAKIGDAPTIQIFASDVDDESIGKARRGIYTESIAGDVPLDRLKRYFVKEDKGYRVKKEVRDMISFTTHNVLRDPPFSKLNLITCRNLMIYLSRDTQERLIQLFHFALRPDGFLFLGSAETADAEPLLFSPHNKKQRIYLRRPTNPIGAIPPLTPAVQERWQPGTAQISARQGERRFSFEELHFRLIERVAPPSLLVNEDYEIVHLSENAGRYLHFIGGEPTIDLLRIINEDLRADLRAALFMAKRERRQAEVQGIRAQIGGETRLVDLTVKVIEAPDASGDFLLVIFEETAAREMNLREALTAGRVKGENGALDAMSQHLEEELRRTKDRLRATVEQYDTSIAELKASNEELQAINEELRSATEELETSKEEMQSVNEELTTVNQELKEKLDELSGANSDLQNLMQSTNIATIFLDCDLQIKRFTQSAQQVFNIINTDIGRPLGHLTHQLDYPQFVGDAEEVLRTLRTVEREISGRKGNFYLARVLPYRTLEERIDGIVLTFLDITNRKRADEALKFQSLLLDTVEQSVIATNLEGKVTYWNHSAEKLFGWTAEEAVGQSILELNTPETKQAQAEEIMSRLNRGENWNGEFTVRRRDGSQFLAQVSNVPINDDKGNLIGVVGVATDITERKRIEEALRHNHEMFSAMVENAPFGIYMVDADFRLRTINKGAQAVFRGIEPLIGRDFADILRAVWKEPFATEAIEKFHHTLRTGESYYSPTIAEERRNIEKNESYDWQLHRIVLPDGTYNVVCYFYDLSERKRMEKSLRESEEHLRLLIESVDDYAILTLTPDNRINSWNSGAEKIFGFTEEEILGESSEIIFTPEDCAAEQPEWEIQTAIETGRAADERWHIRKDGSRFYASGVLTVLGENAENGFVKILRDLTERKQFEETLREADRRKDEFIATLAHELRNPLAPIRTALEIMRRNDDKEREDNAREIIERQTNQLVHLVDDLLDISRITQGKIKLRKERMNIADSIAAAVETVQPFVESQRHRLDVRQPDAPVFVEADRTRLTQIVLNLLHNSAKYTEPGGHILIIAGQEGDEAVIRVRDNGIGIQFEMLSSIFDMFAQTALGEKRGQGGLGIGLSLVKKLIEMHNGKVEAHSEGEGKGSEFVIRLPRAADQQPELKNEKQDVKKTNEAEKKHRILVVDDNADAANMLEIFLSMENHEVRTAFSGRDALEKAAEMNPDTAILDIGLPDMNGYELAKLLREEFPDICLIALSGWGQDEDRRRSKEAGFNQHLVKPVDVGELKKFLCC